MLEPIRERRHYWEQRIPEVYEILRAGSKEAEAAAAATLHDVREAMRINYFDDEALMNQPYEKATLSHILQSPLSEQEEGYFFGAL